ncbi:protein kinase domain-containing protein, partial [Haematococcus lacustris]
VKRLKPDLTQSEVDVVGMVREVALLRRLQNQHIVEYLGYGHWHWSKPPSLQPALGNQPGPCGLDPAVQQQASLFIVEELVDGGSLRAVVARQMRHAREGRVYRAEDAMRWLMQVPHA